MVAKKRYSLEKFSGYARKCYGLTFFSFFARKYNGSTYAKKRKEVLWLLAITKKRNSLLQFTKIGEFLYYLASAKFLDYFINF